MSPSTTMTSQELRKLLEAVWQNPRIACPNHIALWSFRDGEGWRYKNHLDLPIYYRRGKLQKIAQKISRSV